MSLANRIRPGAVAAALALLLPLNLAGAQCLISGGSSLCNGPVQLCGPEGVYEYMWIDPLGNFSFDRCLTAAEPGTYMLRITDQFGTSYGPCSKVIEASNPAPCAITGPTSSCEGTPVELCGPAGEFRYSWTGPNGFTSSAACVQVSVGGLYRLSVWRLSDNCPETVCEQTVTFTSCDTVPPPPPPPPAPNPYENCPRPAWFWMLQCIRTERNVERVDPVLLGQMASIMDAASGIFTWTEPREGFTATMHPRHSTLRARAKRQFAAVHANVCAGEVGLPRVAGYLIRLDPATPIQMRGITMTVGEWLASTDAELLRLESRDRWNREVKEAYRRIIRTAWYINHGRVVGPVCGRRPMDRDDDDRVVSPNERSFEEALAAELADDMDAGPARAFGTPNPFTAFTTVTFVVGGSTTQDVTLGVYDVAGRMVRELARGPMEPGTHEARWDGRGANGAPARSGVYFVRGVIGSQRIAGQLTFLR